MDEADDIAAYAGRQYCDFFRDKYDYWGGKFRPGLFCLSSNTPLGGQVIALPSGRVAASPLADGGISPKHGMDTHGPTAAARSVAKLDHMKATNGVNFNLKFIPATLKTRQDRAKLAALIRAYFAMDGFHVQFNILSSKTLIDAQRNPAKHRGLVVRVAGYSAYFVELCKEVQDEIISRTVLDSF
jgi:formate C-acetyltransferase